MSKTLSTIKPKESFTSSPDLAMMTEDNAAEDEADYTLAGQFVRGPYHYGKSYYTNFIKYDNRNTFN